MEDIKHKDQEKISKKFNMKTFARNIDPRKMVAFKDLSKNLTENLVILETEILKVQHNQVEFGKYLDDILERVKKLNEDE